MTSKRDPATARDRDPATASAERGSCTVPPPPRTHPTDPGHDVSRGAPVGAGWSTSSVCYCRALPIDPKTVCVLTMGSDEVVVAVYDEGCYFRDVGQLYCSCGSTSCTMPPKIVSKMTLVTVHKIGGEPTKPKDKKVDGCTWSQGSTSASSKAGRRSMEAKATAVVNVPREGQRPVMTSLVGPFEAEGELQ
ncbi:hypothetical protein PHYSODRAFT_322833 [Phytophthora sojae]|uniref:Uncharacterized protein n=1 Tax=Phytophthora sojae (strain P6497) TaxID=1094619 RepID=G4YMV1_PHYSP|nr:hypothetical protein PHYSODRAFT_322833 [Phytophthora sojae]EGZ29296.1 hypothetical protein PHYSODRAFT_322833 [Phytophthora sojae]|eukprot:XP_009516571.1 hypothetical protein PHYSODRAFT_322833 [Phytophthora sojae]